MPKAYCLDLRERAVSRVVAGESVRSVAAVLEVSVSSVVKWSQRYRATGSAAPGRVGGRPRPSPLAPHRAWLLERINSGEHITLRGLQAELAMRGTQVDYGTVWNFVHAEGLSFKKTVLPSEQHRPDGSCMLPPNEPSKQPGKPQAGCSNASPQTNAETISLTQDTLQHEIISL